jgi:hypothetical protein
LDPSADYLDDVGTCDEIIDEILRNQSGHNELNASSAVSGLTSVVIG